MQNIATMKNVVKRYKGKLALDNLSLEIPEGKIVGLLGPNGAGKTTSIRTLCGLTDADSGEISLLGERQNSKNLKVRRNIGLVTQDITIFEDIKAIENLKYFGGLYGLKGAELNKNVAEVLEFVELTDRATHKPKTFSGGMKRRLNIAASLVHKPKLVIMDEPTVGIDPQSRNHILEQKKKLQKQGTTVIYTTHYMEEVEAICDYIAIVDAGRVIAKGTLDELVGKVQHEDKIELSVVTYSDDLASKYKNIHGVKKVEQVGNAFTVISVAGSGNLNEILAVSPVSNFNQDKPTLEDVFLTLTGKKLRDGGE